MYIEDTRVCYYYCVSQSHSYFQAHLLGFLKMFIHNVAVYDNGNEDRGFNISLVMHCSHSSGRNRGSVLSMLSPQVHGVRIIVDLR